MFPVIRHSISEARTQHRTGHQDIRTYFYDTAAPIRTMNAALATAISPVSQTVGPRPPAIRQRLQQARTQPALTSTDIRRCRACAMPCIICRRCTYSFPQSPCDSQQAVARTSALPVHTLWRSGDQSFLHRELLFVERQDLSLSDVIDSLCVEAKGVIETTSTLPTTGSLRTSRSHRYSMSL
jgi:hypothetical protein